MIVCEQNPPTVKISSPSPNEWVNGTVHIQGKANDVDAEITKVEVKIDDGIWQTAVGTSDWSHVWHTKLLGESDGVHQISARSYNGLSYSEEKTIMVTVNNQKPQFFCDVPTCFGSLCIEVKNRGDEQATNISCSVDVFGGFFGLIHADAEQLISWIDVDQVAIIEVDEPLFGFGPLDITLELQAEHEQKVITEIHALILGFLIL